MTKAPFSTLSDLAALIAQAPGPSEEARTAAEARNGQLTKPPGALGRLEDIAIWYAAWRGAAAPRITRPQVAIFAGNHGVAARGVSAFPAEVTAQMVANFAAGGAAINQLARTQSAHLTVTPLDLETPTADFTQGPAMAEETCVAALAKGWQALDPETDILVVGEMGIANTTSAAAIAHLIYGADAADWTGRGTGVDDAGLALKIQVVGEALARHRGASGLSALAAVGGRELAAMAGAIAAARLARVPVILDGFIATAAAACLESEVPGALDHIVAGHVSVEPGHARLLTALGKAPLLSLGMRLGEGSGAAVALGIVRAAVDCHAGMATFAEAGVTGG